MHPVRLPGFSPGCVAHRAAEFIELAQHHQARDPEGHRGFAAGDAAAVLHQTKAAFPHRNRARFGLRAAGRVADEHQRSDRQFGVAGAFCEVVQDRLDFDRAESAV